MALLRYAAKCDPFLSLDCARVEGGDQILPSGNTAGERERHAGLLRRDPPGGELQRRRRGPHAAPVQDQQG